MAESLEEEVVRLRAVVETYKQRELDTLKVDLAQAQQAAAHYKAEAERNAELGRQIAAGYQEQLTELRAKLDGIKRIENTRVVPGFGGT